MYRSSINKIPLIYGRVRLFMEDLTHVSHRIKTTTCLLQKYILSTGIFKIFNRSTINRRPLSGLLWMEDIYQDTSSTSSSDITPLIHVSYEQNSSQKPFLDRRSLTEFERAVLTGPLYTRESFSRSSMKKISYGPPSDRATLRNLLWTEDLLQALNGPTTYYNSIIDRRPLTGPL